MTFVYSGKRATNFRTLTLSVSAVTIMVAGSAQTASAVEPLLQMYGYSILTESMRDEFPTLRERLGNERLGTIASGGASAAETQMEVWARIDALYRDSNAIRGDVTNPITDHYWEQYRGEFAVGFDMPVRVGGGTVLLGASGHAVYSTAEAHGFTPGGAEVDTTGFGLGVEAAYFAGGGLYVDLQGRLSFWDADVDVDPRNVFESVDGISWGLSLEGGSRFELGGSTAVSPRLQVVYTDVDFDGFTDDEGVVVRQKDSASLVLSAGVLVEWAISENGVSVYGDLSASWDALDDSSISASQFEVRSGLEDYWGNLAVGVAMPLGERVSGYLQVEYGSALEENFLDSDTYGGIAGIRIDL